MASIEIEADKLHERAHTVQNMLTPLRPVQKSRRILVACKLCKKQYRGCKVVAAHEGIKNGESFDKWYFRTFATDIWSQYSEFWKPINGQRKYFLNRAYLNILITNRETHKFDKLVSIHCDPYDKGNEPLCTYKRGPHLHVQKAEHPIPKCHFPLNLTELNKILSSIEKITTALEDAIKIICNEVLSRYN
ncbi:MAG: hypothetical protein KAS04_05335 [Candidatus Aenigmarchaeota archaeon]|nr:hypothetical protein [Candidatus Aenigmarchaeota archaeon]